MRVTVSSLMERQYGQQFTHPLQAYHSELQLPQSGYVVDQPLAWADMLANSKSASPKALHQDLLIH